jgi:hypothetical protein
MPHFGNAVLPFVPSLTSQMVDRYSWLPGVYTGFGGSGGGFFNAAARRRMYSK